MNGPSFHERYPQVAPRPIIDITFDVDEGGNEIALVEGLDVTPRDGEDARDAAIRTVDDMVDTVAGTDADGRPYEALKVRVVGDPFRRFAIIHRDGRLYVPNETPEDISQFRDFDAEHPPFPLDTGALPGGDLFRHRRSGPRADPAEPQDSKNADPADEPGLAVDEIGRRFGNAFARDDAELDGRSPQSDPLEQDTDAALEERFAAHFTGHHADLPDDEHSDPAEPDTGGLPTNGRVPALVAPGHPVGETFGAGVASAAQRLSAAARSGLPPAGASPHPAVRPRPARRLGGVAGGAEPAATAGSAPALSTRTRRLGLLAVVLSIVAVSSVVAVMFATDGGTRIESQPVPVTTPPPGWASAASWATGPLAAEAGPVITFGDRLAYVTAHGEVVVADAATGEQAWSQEIDPAGIRGPLALTRLAGTEAVAIHTGDRLLAWSTKDGHAVAAADLPGQAQVTYLGPAPLVGTEASTVAVVGPDGLLTVAVPPGAYALAAHEDRSVTAAGSDGWWHLRPDVTPGEARPWENANPEVLPADADPEVLGYLGNSIVLRYPAFRDQRPQIVVHTDSPGNVRVAFRGPSEPASSEDVLIAAPTKAWGVHGRTLIDVTAGSVTDLGGWTTAAVTADRAYGTVGEAPAVVAPGGAPAQLPPGVETPEAHSPAGAVIRLAGPALTADGTTAWHHAEQGVVLVPPAG